MLHTPAISFGETMRQRLWMYVPFFLFMLQPALSSAQKQMTPQEDAVYRDMLRQSGVDPEEMKQVMKAAQSAQKWADAKAVHYHIVGVYDSRTMISSEPGKGFAYADVTDRVVIDLDWKLTEVKLLGTPTFQNTKSTLKNLRDPVAGCLPPLINGEYEHFELLDVKNGLSGSIDLQVQTSFPVVQVAQACVGSRKSIPAARKTRPENMMLPSPMSLDQAEPPTKDWKFSPDKKSMITQKGGWTWTYTPTVKSN